MNTQQLYVTMDQTQENCHIYVWQITDHSRSAIASLALMHPATTDV
jgi:hypothetical protein